MRTTSGFFSLFMIIAFPASAENALELEVYRCSTSSQSCEDCKINPGGKVRVVPKKKTNEVLVQYPNGQIDSLKECRFISNSNWDCSHTGAIGPFRSHNIRVMKNGVLRWETYWEAQRPPGDIGKDSYWCFK